MSNKREARSINGAPKPATPSASEGARWRSRYLSAEHVLLSAGIQSCQPTHDGVELYIRLRSNWNAYIEALAPAMLYDVTEIDPAQRTPVPAKSEASFRGPRSAA